MFNKHIKNSIIVIFLILLISNISFAENTIVDTTKLDKGVIGINYNKNTDNMKILITKGKNRENYDLETNIQYPLQFGNGEYSILVLEHVTGNKYRVVAKETVNLKLKDQQVLFLQSTHMVNWNNDMLAIKKAKELTKDMKTDVEKLKAIYNFVINNVKYDYNKANTVQAGYLPSIDATLESNSGICYDYSVLTAGMLRSIGIPTKLIMGDNVDIRDYHAWNEVYINGKWQIIDTTYDSAYAEKNILINMIKDASDYKVKKEY